MSDDGVPRTSDRDGRPPRNAGRRRPDLPVDPSDGSDDDSDTADQTAGAGQTTTNPEPPDDGGSDGIPRTAPTTSPSGQSRPDQQGGESPLAPERDPDVDPEQAAELRREAAADDPDVHPQDIRVEREGDQLRAELDDTARTDLQEQAVAEDLAVGVEDVTVDEAGNVDLREEAQRELVEERAAEDLPQGPGGLDAERTTPSSGGTSPGGAGPRGAEVWQVRRTIEADATFSPEVENATLTGDVVDYVSGAEVGEDITDPDSPVRSRTGAASDWVSDRFDSATSGRSPLSMAGPALAAQQTTGAEPGSGPEERQLERDTLGALNAAEYLDTAAAAGQAATYVGGAALEGDVDETAARATDVAEAGVAVGRDAARYARDNPQGFVGSLIGGSIVGGVGRAATRGAGRGARGARRDAAALAEDTRGIGQPPRRGGRSSQDLDDIEMRERTRYRDADQQAAEDFSVDDLQTSEASPEARLRSDTLSEAEVEAAFEARQAQRAPEGFESQAEFERTMAIRDARQQVGGPGEFESTAAYRRALAERLEGSTAVDADTVEALRPAQTTQQTAQQAVAAEQRAAAAGAGLAPTGAREAESFASRTESYEAAITPTAQTSEQETTLMEQLDTSAMVDTPATQQTDARSQARATEQARQRADQPQATEQTVAQRLTLGQRFQSRTRTRTRTDSRQRPRPRTRFGFPDDGDEDEERRDPSGTDRLEWQRPVADPDEIFGGDGGLPDGFTGSDGGAPWDG